MRSLNRRQGARGEVVRHQGDSAEDMNEGTGGSAVAATHRDLLQDEQIVEAG